MIPRDLVVAEARRWLGVRWVHQGRSEHGIDCVGLVVKVARALNISDYDFKGYPRDPVAGEFVGHFLAGGGTRIPIPNAQPADLMVFRDNTFPCHVGIVAAWDDGPTLIHAHAARRKVVEERMVGDWGKQWVAAFAMPGVG